MRFPIACACAQARFATFAFKMALDCKGNRRGRCLVCIECREFTNWVKNVRCAYCDCPPTKHEILTEHENATREGELFTGENVNQQDERSQNENKVGNFEVNPSSQFQPTIEDDVPIFGRGNEVQPVILFCNNLEFSVS